MAETEIESLQVIINNRLQLLTTLIKSLKMEADRAIGTLARYRSQSNNDGLFAKAEIKGSNFKEIQDYNNLISKQFCGRLEQLRKSYLALKIEMEGIAKRYKTKPQAKDQQRISAISNTIKQFQARFAQIWREQHFLVLNYKLDCAAKELQRWTAVMESNKKTPQTITQMVNNMFS